MATQLGKRPQLVAGRPRSRSQRQTERALRERTRHWHSSIPGDERARGGGLGVAAAADASGWGSAFAPGGLARDIALQTNVEPTQGMRPTTPEAVMSANTAALTAMMARISTSMGMTQGKRSSMASLMDPRASGGSSAREDRPEAYCYSPGRSSVMTLSTALTQSAPSLGPGGMAQPQRRLSAREVTEDDKPEMLAELDRRVRHATFLRGEAGPRPSSGVQLVDAAMSTRTRSLLDGSAAAAENDADRLSFLRANLKPTPTVITPPTETTYVGVGGAAGHSDRVAELLSQMQEREETPGPNPNTGHNSHPAAFNPFSQAAKAHFRSSWVVRPAGGDHSEDEDEVFSYEPSIGGIMSPTGRRAEENRARQPSAASVGPYGREFFTTPPSPLTAMAGGPGNPFMAGLHRERGDAGMQSAERARKAIAKMKADKKAREAENAEFQRKKKDRCGFQANFDPFID